MALLIRDYPDTRLDEVEQSDRSLRNIVEFGSQSDHVSPLSPPWRDELTSMEISAVTAFVGLLRDDFPKASELIASVDISPEYIDGKKIYRARCEGCHGVAGEGDGRMSRVIKDPPPANLTHSTLSYEQTIAIISAGGGALGRSPRMPPWGQELLAAELVSVADYLQTLRAKPE